MMKWTASFQAFALAAHACDMWTYVAAMGRLRVCTQVAVRAFADVPSRRYAVLCLSQWPRGRFMRSSIVCVRHQLAQFDEETARREWCEKAERGMCHLCAPHVAVPKLSLLGAGDVDFDVNAACLKEDPELLARAKAAYDSAYTKARQTAAPTQGGGGELSWLICLPHVGFAPLSLQGGGGNSAGPSRGQKRRQPRRGGNGGQSNSGQHSSGKRSRRNGGWDKRWQKSKWRVNVPSTLSPTCSRLHGTFLLGGRTALAIGTAGRWCIKHPERLPVCFSFATCPLTCISVHVLGR